MPKLSFRIDSPVARALASQFPTVDANEREVHAFGKSIAGNILHDWVKEHKRTRIVNGLGGHWVRLIGNFHVHLAGDTVIHHLDVRPEAGGLRVVRNPPRKRS